MNASSNFLKIGITGGIGSGKTTVSKIIEKLGYPVFYSDLEAKNLMTTSEKIMTMVVELFGAQAYVNGELNRAYLAHVAFNNPSLLQALNQVIHPEVRNLFERFCLKNQHKKLIFNEAAILFETGAYKTFHANVLVTADEALRIERVCKRDHISEEQVKGRMKNQWDDSQKIPLADFVIYNNQEALEPQIERVLNELQNRVEFCS